MPFKYVVQMDFQLCIRYFGPLKAPVTYKTFSATLDVLRTNKQQLIGQKFCYTSLRYYGDVNHAKLGSFASEYSIAPDERIHSG